MLSLFKILSSRTLAGVLAFSLFAGVVSGIVTAASFMPSYSLHYNWRQWYPGTTEITVLGQDSELPERRVIHASGWDELRETGMPASRLWLFDAKTAQETDYALVGHGIWRRNLLRLRDEIILDLDSGPIIVPVAGVWHPFHPQLGDNWVVLVGDSDISAATGIASAALAPIPKLSLLPPGYQGGELLSWMLFNTLGFLLYGAIGLIDRKGISTTIGWAVKLWMGGGVAIVAGLMTAAVVFRVFLPLPLLGLLPMTLGMLAASYLLALLLLTGLCVVLFD